MNINKTISAIATPVGAGGIAIVRISGSKACDIAKKMAKPLNDNSENAIMFLSAPRYMQLVKVDCGNFFDIGLAVYFKAPESFTGEDVVEFHVHGGVKLAESVVKHSIKLGAKPALAGEFSHRAFLNGKLSLEKAEGIIDLINANTESELKAGSKLADGGFYEFVKDSQNIALEILASFNTLLDYPSENLEDDEDFLSVYPKLETLINKLSEIYKSYSAGKIIKNGIDVAILGRTNAGKSSLLNALTKTQSAIVTNIHGTTRDVVKQSFIYNGIKFNFLDTAGIRETNDEVEKIGINLSKQTAKDADIVLYVVDAVEKNFEEDLKNLNMLQNKNVIVLINKTDLNLNFKDETFKKYKTIKISVLKDENLNKVLEALYNTTKINEFNLDSLILTNLRHANAIEKALQPFKQALDGLNNLELVILAHLIQAGYDALGEITGESGSDTVINEIFAKFCVGK